MVEGDYRKRNPNFGVAGLDVLFLGGGWSS